MANRVNISRYLPLSLAALALLGGLLLVLSSFLAYPSLKAVLDPMAQDGSLEIFTRSLHQQLIPILRWSGLALIGIGVVCLLFRDALGSWSSRLVQSIAAYSLRDDLRQVLRALRPPADEHFFLIFLAGITLLAAIIRGLSLFAPMLHDEAYTYIAFASRPLRYVLSDYHLPNNHIFHTLLVFISTRLLGNHPWAVRLPAYLAGVLTVPAAYQVGKLAYDKSTGLIAAALVAASGALINYSTNARGYALIAFFFMISLIIGDYVRRRSSPIGWVVLILVSTLGFYTIPIMLYPFGIVMTWLFLSWFGKDVHPTQGWAFMGWLALSGLAVILFTSLLYSPVILIGSGWDSLAGNNFVASLGWGNLLESLPGRARSAWGLWMDAVPSIAIMITVIGFFGSLALHRRISTQRAPVQIAAVLWIAAALAIQRVAPLARVWLFLLPIYLVWSAAGWVGLFHLLPVRINVAQGYRLAALLAIAIPAVQLYVTAAEFKWPIENPGLEEQIAVYLEDHLQPGDTVVADAPLRAMLEYYFSAYGISRDYFYQEETSSQRAWVVVGEQYGQSLEGILEREGLGREVSLESKQFVESFDRATLYRFEFR